MIEKFLIGIIAGIGALIYAFRSGQDEGRQKAKNQSLTETIKRNEETRKSQTKFNDVGNAGKRKWLLKHLKQRNKDSKRFLQ